MKNIILTFFFCSQLTLLAYASDSSETSNSAASDKVFVGATAVTVTSPSHRVALLELYTSEGCSSCPPADRFLNNLKKEGVSDKQIIPLAFHVTYWDYIGWKDRFAKPQFDSRQRDLARKKKLKTVYTPQFVLAGDDFRRYAHFSKDVNRLVSSKSKVSLSLTIDSAATHNQSINSRAEELHIRLSSDISKTEVKDVALYIALVENNLNSNVSDGENEGEVLQHNYVVRELSAPYFQSKPVRNLEKEHVFPLDPEWKKQDLSIVAFAENPHTGEILQAVKYSY